MQPKILLLTGAAAGKNTTSHLYVTSFARGADIDADLVRWMQRQPHGAPWDAGFQVVICDVVLPALLDDYHQYLAGYSYRIAKLMPAWGVCLARLHERRHTISAAQVRYTYEQMQQLTDVAMTIDNSNTPPEQMVQQLWRLMSFDETES